MAVSKDGTTYTLGRCAHGFTLYWIIGAGALHSHPRKPKRGEAFGTIDNGIRVYRCGALGSMSELARMVTDVGAPIVIPDSVRKDAERIRNRILAEAFD